MKKGTLIIFFFSILGYSQSNDKEIKSFYYNAISNHLNEMKKLIDNKSTTLKLEELYFTSEDIPINLLPVKVDDYKINYIDIYNKRNRKKLKKGITIIAIKPLNLNKNEIIITLINFKVCYKNNNYNQSNGGGSVTKYNYSCSENKWIFQETEFTGI